MRVVVVYESMYGNTRRIAEAVGRGLAAGGEVEVLPVGNTTPELLRQADLVVAGGPTHVHSMARPSSRKAALKRAQQDGSAVESADPDTGVREWLATLGPSDALAAAFDTRNAGPSLLTGQASKGISKGLERAGFHTLAKPTSFFVGSDGGLVAGEETRAEIWGAWVADQAIRKTPSPAR